MDVLGYLKNRQNELERVNHPFSTRNLNFRYLYSYGVGIMALGNMKAITELQDKYNFFLECIALPMDQREKIMVDINNHFEFRLTECIKILKTKDVQYCFLADLFKLNVLAMWSVDYCKKVIENFMQIFHMTEPEINFFHAFGEAATKRDVQKAQKEYHQFSEAGFDISYQILQYFFPEFTDENFYESIVVAAGKTLVLDKPTTISGNVVVERGGSILFEGASVSIMGFIFVNGGRIQFANTHLSVLECEKDFFLEVQDAAVVRIENTTIDCQNNCGFLLQTSGRLLIDESEFFCSKKKRMIHFCGIYAQILQSSFSEGDAGFIKVSDSAQMQIANCDFVQCHAEYGGAFFSDSIDNVAIRQSSFRECCAKYIGAAVYFKYQKLGQVVVDCVYQKCEPEQTAVFNVYEDDFELKVR